MPVITHPHTPAHEPHFTTTFPTFPTWVDDSMTHLIPFSLFFSFSFFILFYLLFSTLRYTSSHPTVYTSPHNHTPQPIHTSHFTIFYPVTHLPPHYSLPLTHITFAIRHTPLCALLGGTQSLISFTLDPFVQHSLT